MRSIVKVFNKTDGQVYHKLHQAIQFLRSRLGKTAISWSRVTEYFVKSKSSALNPLNLNVLIRGYITLVANEAEIKANKQSCSSSAERVSWTKLKCFTLSVVRTTSISMGLNSECRLCWRLPNEPSETNSSCSAKIIWMLLTAVTSSTNGPITLSSRKRIPEVIRNCERQVVVTWSRVSVDSCSENNGANDGSGLVGVKLRQ